VFVDAAPTKFERHIGHGLGSGLVLTLMILERLATVTDQSAVDVIYPDFHHLPRILLVFLKLLVLESHRVF
jgi:hypothetical protein